MILGTLLWNGLQYLSNISVVIIHLKGDLTGVSISIVPLLCPLLLPLDISLVVGDTAEDFLALHDLPLFNFLSLSRKGGHHTFASLDTVPTADYIALHEVKVAFGLGLVGLVLFEGRLCNAEGDLLDRRSLFLYHSGCEDYWCLLLDELGQIVFNEFFLAAYLLGREELLLFFG